MAARDIPGRIGEAELRGYLTRILQDEELRGNLASAYGAARSAYGRLSNGKGLSTELLEDRKLQRELTQIARSLRDASGALREPPKRRRKRRRGRGLLLLIAGAALAIALTPGLRSKVLDLMFGAEEEFDYSSTTTPSEPAPVSAPAA